MAGSSYHSPLTDAAVFDVAVDRRRGTALKQGTRAIGVRLAEAALLQEADVTRAAPGLVDLVLRQGAL